MRTSLHVLLGVLAASTFALGSAHASPNTDRIVRNLQGTLDNVTIVPAYATGAVPEKERQAAANLLRDVDYALKRADGDLGRVPPAEQGDAAVQGLVKRVADLRAYRDKLAKNLEASKAAGAELDKQYRAFREAAKPYGKALDLVQSGGKGVPNLTADALTDAVATLAKLDQLCTTSYAGIEFNDRLAFQLAINPVQACETAAKRQELAAGIARSIIQADLSHWLRSIDEIRTKLAANQGLFSPSGEVMNALLFDREKGKAALLDKHRPMFTAFAIPIRPDLMAPFDKAIDDLWAEIDRLAPTFSFPATTHHDGGAEAGAKKALAEFEKGAKIQKTAMLYADWSIAKNEIDIPTERYRTGGILYKAGASKWCQYREFTAHHTYTGGGRYASKPTYTFGALRYQQCK